MNRDQALANTAVGRNVRWADWRAGTDAGGKARLDRGLGASDAPLALGAGRG